MSSSILISTGLPGMSRMRTNVIVLVTKIVSTALRIACVIGRPHIPPRFPRTRDRGDRCMVRICSSPWAGVMVAMSRDYPSGGEPSGCGRSSATSQPREQPEDLDVQPDEGHEERKRHVPLHVLRSTRGHSTFRQVEVEQEIERGDPDDEDVDGNAKARLTRPKPRSDSSPGRPRD